MTITVRIDPPAEGDAYETHPACIRPLWDVADAAALYLQAEAMARNHATRKRAAQALANLGKALDALAAAQAVARKLSG
jgi:hypothetical protein